jgi:hypothetical protein
MDKEKEYKIYEEFEKKFNSIVINSLRNESDRAKIILSISWADFFLEGKIKTELSKGNKDAKKNLFSANGPFATFSAKLNLAFCAGWIDADVYHDLQIIRKLRNKCAHSIDIISLEQDIINKEIQKFKVPNRKFYDWGKIWVVSTEDGIEISSGKKPNHVIEDLGGIPGSLTLIIAIPVILFVAIHLRRDTSKINRLQQCLIIRSFW